MKKFTLGLILTLLVSTGLMAVEAVKTPQSTEASDANHVRVFTVDNSDGKITAKSIEKAFEKEGFMIEANNDMTAPFKRDFKEAYYDVYNLMVLWKKETVLALAEEYPKVGLFSPLSMSIYTAKGGKTISVASLSVEGYAAMTGVPADNAALVALGKSIDAALKAAMPKGHFETMPYKMKAPEGPLVHEASFKVGEEWEDDKDDLEMKFEGELAPNGFVSPAFVDINYDLDEHDKDTFKFFDTYSICKIKVIYTVSQKHPEAGALAPCTMYLYLKKDKNTIHMGFPTVHKWISALNITDKESIDVLLDAQGKFEKILAKLTGKVVEAPKAEVKKETVKAEPAKKCSAGGKCGKGKCGSAK